MLCNSKIFQEKKWWMKEKCVERSLINNKTPHSIMNKLFIIQLCLCQYCAFITNLWNMSSRKHVLVKLSQKKKKKKGKKLRKEASYTLKVTAPMNKSVNNTNSTLATPTLIGSYLWANGGHTHTVTINNLFHLNQIKQLDAMLPRICIGMDHGRSDMNTDDTLGCTSCHFFVLTTFWH